MIVYSQVEWGGALAYIKSGAEVAVKEVNDVGRGTGGGWRYRKKFKFGEERIWGWRENFTGFTSRPVARRGWGSGDGIQFVKRAGGFEYGTEVRWSLIGDPWKRGENL